MSDFMNTVYIVGDEALTASIIDRSIAEIKDSNITDIGKYAFYECTALTTVDLPAVTSITDCAFTGCTSLATVNLPVVTSIGTSVFRKCSTLATVNFPVATSVGNSAFYECSNLTTVDLPAATSVEKNAFYKCTGLTALILRSDTMATLAATNAFTSTAINSSTGYIYVPRALVDSYKTASNWKNYANQFRAIEDYPEITGGV